MEHPCECDSVVIRWGVMIKNEMVCAWVDLFFLVKSGHFLKRKGFLGVRKWRISLALYQTIGISGEKNM